MEESIGFLQIFDFRFLMDLHVLGCPDHDLTISGKCLSVWLCVCDKNFVASVTRELMHRISWNFILSVNINLLYHKLMFFNFCEKLTGSSVVLLFTTFLR